MSEKLRCNSKYVVIQIKFQSYVEMEITNYRYCLRAEGILCESNSKRRFIKQIF